jgi:hypothetical protein
MTLELCGQWRKRLETESIVGAVVEESDDKEVTRWVVRRTI